MSPLLGNRRCHGNHFVLHSGGLPHVSFQVWTWYDHPVLSNNNFYLDTLCYVVTLTFLTLESGHVMPLGWSIRVPSLIWLTIPELGQLQFSIDRQLKVPIFTFLGVKGVKFNLSNPQKALPWGERRIMTYWALGCVQKCDLWAWRRNEKRTETFMRQTGYLPRPPTST